MAKSEKLRQILDDIGREGLSFVEGVLNSRELAAINTFFDQHQSEFAPAKVGARDHKQRVESIRGDYTFWIDPLSPPEPFTPVMTFLETLRLEVNERFFLGLKQYECHLASYPPGSFYAKHLDRFETNSSRSLSFVFYLNKSWNQSFGGELLIYDMAGSVLRNCLPNPGSFVTFLSDEFPHEVKASTQERRSLTGWMHTSLIY